MARAKTSRVPAAGDLAALIDEAGRLAVRVTPGAREASVEIDGRRALVRVRARPEGGKANQAVRALLANVLGLAQSRINLERGAASRDKVYRIET